MGDLKSNTTVALVFQLSSGSHLPRADTEIQPSPASS